MIGVIELYDLTPSVCGNARLATKGILGRAGADRPGGVVLAQVERLE